MKIVKKQSFMFLSCSTTFGIDPKVHVFAISVDSTEKENVIKKEQRMFQSISNLYSK